MDEGRAGVYIKELNFFGGAKLELSDNSITVLVGPNNSGKSLSLYEIKYIIENGSARTRSVSSVTIQRVGDVGTLGKLVAQYKNKNDGYYYWGASEYSHVSEKDIDRSWKQDESKLGNLSDLFIAYLTTQTRLNDSNPVPSFDSSKTRVGIHPIHSLYLDSDKEEEVSGLFRKYFGHDLILHRSPGKNIPLYVGDRPELEGNETVTSRTYLDKVEELQTLHNQGDGFRSFASIVLRVWTGNHTVVLVDEPEAFLHPPQARAVGELISIGSNYQKQVFISTHSNDVIQGLLSKFPDRVSVVRLDRSGASHSATYLSNDNVSELWRDPILRYSNVLNGLFHERVVVTEADGDCRFYEAMADAQGLPYKSTFYTYAGGKDRIAVIVRALKALHVPVRVVVDIDIFASDGSLRDIIESYGYDWSNYKDRVANVRRVIQSKKSWLIGFGFKERVAAIISNIKDNEIVPKETLTKISIAMRETSPWEAIKDGGVSAIPSGDPAKMLKELMDSLKHIGIHVVPVGQMERFCTTIGSHGPRWVSEVLKRDLANDSELEGARLFVSDLVFDAERMSEQSNIRHSFGKRLKLSRKEVTAQNLNILLRISGNIARIFFFVSVGSLFAIQLLRLIYDYLVQKGFI